jgi:peptide/nickel transport system permease protein
LNFRWLLRRVGIAIIIFFVALFLNFIIPRLMPGDPINYFTMDLTDVQIKEIMARYGLNEPLYVQFWKYIGNVFDGYWGYSFDSKVPVTDIIIPAMGWSLLLIIPAMLIQVTIAYFVGVAAGWKAGGKLDSITQGVALAIWSTPMFWMAMMAFYIFSATLGWFPLGHAMDTAVEFPNIFAKLINIIYHMILPVGCMVLNSFGGYQLIMRNTMVTTLKENYVVTAEAKGISENKVKYKHAARNAMLPMFTSVALRFSLAVAGSIFTEIIFSYPGVGRRIFLAVGAFDFPVLQGAFLILSISVIIISLLVDIMYSRLDPRIRY